MPEELHRELDKRAKEMGMAEGSDEYNRYVYGTLQKVEKQKKQKEDSENYDIAEPPFE